MPTSESLPGEDAQEERKAEMFMRGSSSMRESFRCQIKGMRYWKNEADMA